MFSLCFLSSYLNPQGPYVARVLDVRTDLLKNKQTKKVTACVSMFILLTS